MAKTGGETKVKTADFLIGMGASAGGLDALKAFFAEMSPRSGFAFVVVQHVEQNSQRLLVDALAGATQMAVYEIRDKTPVEPQCVYVTPANTSVEIKKNLLRLKNVGSENTQPHPIDRFFYSLADEKQSDAIGIILSGAGSDGTLGLKAISNAGGMTMAQAPKSAAYDAMPRNAITTGVVDHVLPPGEMPEELVAYVRHLRKVSNEEREAVLREDIAGAIPTVAEILQKQTNHNFQHYKTSTLVRRIQRRMQVLRTASIERYVKRLRHDEEERSDLFRELLIGVTAFFRDPEAFEALAEHVIEDVFQRSNRPDPVRIWVPGCASGEEAYTIAMLCREKMDELDDPPEVQIFATDIDERALNFARQGVYPAGIAENLTPERLKRFFVKRSRRYHVAKEIRELCLFSVHNLISDPPFSRLDVISCRNLLIYLGPHLQKKLIPLFHYALRPGGFLFLGPSENISSHRELFRAVNAKHRISQRKPVATSSAKVLSAQERQAGGTRTAGLPAGQEIDLKQIGQRIVLDEFAPEWAIVNEDAQIVALSDEAGRYLQLSGGAFQNNIIKMARTGLRVGLRAALNESLKSWRRVDHDNVSVRVEGGIQRMMLTVQPMPRAGEDSGLFMVVFHEVGTLVSREKAESTEAADDAGSMIEQLERELSTTRDDLEKSIQDLEVANEELKSSNEELLSMNEELQSANEELETSKDEIQSGNEALTRAKNDLENLLHSTEIATLFLDDALNIQSFTPAVTEIYNLIETDIGRPIWHQTHRAVEMPPLPDAAVLRERKEPVEDIIETTDGHCFTRRVLPYRTHEGKPEGIVVTFTNVTALRHSEERFRALVDVSSQIVWTTAADGSVVEDSPSWRAFTGQAFEERKGWGWLAVFHPDDRDRAEQLWRETVEAKSPIATEYRIRHVSGEWRWTAMRAAPLTGADGLLRGWIGMNTDITERKLYEQQLLEADRHKDEFLAMVAHELRNPLAPIRTAAQVFELVELGDETLVEMRDVIKRQVEHMARLLDDLLDVSRIARGKIDLRRKRINLGEIVRTTAEDLRGTFNEHRVELTVHITAETLMADADPTRISQCVGNLLNNALKFTDEGGRVQLEMTHADHEAIITIRDTGIGIDPDFVTYLFEPFRQADHSLHRSSGGLGLGLAMVKGLVDLHGGRVYVTSDGPGKGSEFTIQLPVEEP